MTRSICTRCAASAIRHSLRELDFAQSSSCGQAWAGPEDSRTRSSPAGASRAGGARRSTIRNSRSAASRPRSIVCWSTAVMPGRASSHSGESSQAMIDSSSGHRRTEIHRDPQRRRPPSGRSRARSRSAGAGRSAAGASARRRLVPVAALEVRSPVIPLPRGVLLQCLDPEPFVDEGERPADVGDRSCARARSGGRAAARRSRSGELISRPTPSSGAFELTTTHGTPSSFSSGIRGSSSSSSNRMNPSTRPCRAQRPQYVEVLAVLAGEPEQQRRVDLVQVLLDADQRAHVERLGRDQRGVAGDHDARSSGSGSPTARPRRSSGGSPAPRPGSRTRCRVSVADPGAAVQRVRDGRLRDVADGGRGR